MASSRMSVSPSPSLEDNMGGSKSLPAASAATNTLQISPFSFSPKYIRIWVESATASIAKTEFLSKVSDSARFGVRLARKRLVSAIASFKLIECGVIVLSIVKYFFQNNPNQDFFVSGQARDLSGLARYFLICSDSET